MKNSRIEIPEDDFENIVQLRIKSVIHSENCEVVWSVFWCSCLEVIKLPLWCTSHIKKGMVSLIETEGGAKKCLLGKWWNVLKLLTINKVTSIAMPDIWKYMKGSENDLLKRKKENIEGGTFWKLEGNVI